MGCFTAHCGLLERGELCLVFDMQVRGLVKQHLESFNYFVRTGIKKIVRANDVVRSTIDPSIYLR